MIVVNLNKSYPAVLSGELTLEDATRGDWMKIADTAIDQYGDVIVGVFRDRVISAFNIVGHERLEGGRVRFEVEDSPEFSSLVGLPSPAGPWKSGQARPIVYVSTETVRNGNAAVIQTGEATRAVVAGYTLTVDGSGHATILPPIGGSVTVASPARASEHRFTYVNEAGETFPAAIVDEHPMGGHIFIEYIQNGAAVLEAVEDNRVGNEEDLRDGGLLE